MSELIPCPFCGGEAEIGINKESPVREYFVGCINCHIRLYKIGYKRFYTEAEAIAAWNSRAAMEFDNWFYLPKPKEPIIEVAETTHAWDGTKVKTDVFYQVQEQAVINWAKELDEHIIKRTCKFDYEQAAEYWQRMYEQTFAERTCHDTGENEWHFVCSACGYEQNGYECWNYCPNCGCKVVK